MSEMLEIVKQSKQFHEKSSSERKEAESTLYMGFLHNDVTRWQSFLCEVFVDNSYTNATAAFFQLKL